MTEFTAKKLGEVLAFCRTGLLLAEKSGEAMVGALGDGEDLKFAAELKSHASDLELIANGQNVQDITFPKAEKTGAKLKQMMELYVGQEWGNPSEIMEWMGFFEGSAIVHWQLVVGSAEALMDENLLQLSQHAVDFHRATLTKVGDALRKIGAKKTK